MKHIAVFNLWVLIDKSANVDLHIVPKVLHHFIIIKLLVLNGGNKRRLVLLLDNGPTLWVIVLDGGVGRVNNNSNIGKGHDVSALGHDLTGDSLPVVTCWVSLVKNVHDVTL